MGKSRSLSLWAILLLLLMSWTQGGLGLNVSDSSDSGKLFGSTRLGTVQLFDNILNAQTFMWFRNRLIYTDGTFSDQGEVLLSFSNNWLFPVVATTALAVARINSGFRMLNSTGTYHQYIKIWDATSGDNAPLLPQAPPGFICEPRNRPAGDSTKRATKTRVNNNKSVSPYLVCATECSWIIDNNGFWVSDGQGGFNNLAPWTGPL
ncbi:unnamed protein product [Calypogeia fissa]